MIELLENERHVRDEGGKRTLCGLPILFAEWTFVSPKHARVSVEAGDRKRVPCPRCWSAMSTPSSGGEGTR